MTVAPLSESRRALPERLADGRVLLEERYGQRGSAYDGHGILVSSLTLTESTDRNVSLGTIKLTAAEADVVNANKRFYSRKVYELATGRAQPLVAQGNFLGEVEHPDIGTLENAAVRFTKLHLNGQFLEAEATILPTPKGSLLRGLWDGGVGLQVSTRGYASLKKGKRQVESKEVAVDIVQEDLTFEGIDFVLFASNLAGRVHHVESIQQEKPVTLETLRQEHPDLVKQLEAAAREGYVAQAEVEGQVTAARAEGVAEGKKVAPEAVTRSDVLEAVKALLPSTALTPVDERVTTLEQSLATVTTERDTLATEKAQQTADAEAARVLQEQTQAEAIKKSAVTEKVDALLKDSKYTDVLREGLLALGSPEAVQAAFDAQMTVITAVEARALVGEGTGTGTADSVVPPVKDERAEAVAEAARIARERDYAGIGKSKAA